MTASAVPALMRALVAVATTALPGVDVFDGPGISDSGLNCLNIGLDDPDARQRTPAAETVQTWASVGARSRDEEGDIVCSALAWNGASDMAAARDDAYAIVDAVAALCRANPALDVPTLLWTSCHGTGQLLQAQETTGATATVIFRIRFRARL